MGSVNQGNQKITFKYKNAFTGEDCNHLLRGGIKPGFYEGYSGIVMAGGNDVTIPPYNLYIKSGEDKLIHVVASSNYTKTISPIHTQEYLYGTYTWVDNINNYLDFNTRSASGVAVDNEIIFGSIASSMGSIVCVSQSGVSWGLYDSVTDSIKTDKINEQTIGSNVTISTGKLLISNTTDSTTKDTGCAIFEGGIGVEKNITCGGILSALAIPQYDYIVSTQALFDALVASATWLGAKNVLFTCNVTRAAQITIPATVEKIHGINDATLTVTGLTDGQYGLGYASVPTDDTQYEIKNLHLSFYGTVSTGTVYGIYNCRSLYNVYSSGGAHTNIVAFIGCKDLINCYGSATASGNNPNAYGFKNCSCLVNCIAFSYADGTNTRTGYGMHTCNRLVNCASIGSANTAGYGYYDCTYAGFCVKNGSSTTATWGGTNSKVRACEDTSDIT